MTDESIWYWIGFNVFVLLMLLLDLGVFHKKDEAPKIKESLLWTLFWILLALIFGLGVYVHLGHTKGLEFITGYLLEKSLSIDNLFVFIMLFGIFRIEPKYQHRVLFWGIFGAIILRAIFIFAGVALLNKFAWIMYVFGVFLIYTGIHMLFEKKDETPHPENNLIIRGFKKIFPVTHTIENHDFFVKKNAKWHATPLFVALLMIELSDVMFAVDSIPAVLSVSRDTFIVYTSNIFAILGLRSLYFAISGIMEYFYYLKYGLAGILGFIGLKMCLNEVYVDFGWGIEISNVASLFIIIGFVAVAIIASVIRQKKQTKTI